MKQKGFQSIREKKYVEYVWKLVVVRFLFLMRTNRKKHKPLNECGYMSVVQVDYVYRPGRNIGRNFSGIRALTAVKISHRSRY